MSCRSWIFGPLLDCFGCALGDAVRLFLDDGLHLLSPRRNSGTVVRLGSLGSLAPTSKFRQAALSQAHFTLANILESWFRAGLVLVAPVEKAGSIAAHAKSCCRTVLLQQRMHSPAISKAFGACRINPQRFTQMEGLRETFRARCQLASFTGLLQSQCWQRRGRVLAQQSLVRLFDLMRRTPQLCLLNRRSRLRTRLLSGRRASR
mmetsp:Transcript_11821/g.28272  ORF Transcript_11821/g.28272 Transcript_11821/m.28272 type:complete len:205 (-) Transcript_11821:1205-1819(-)